MHLKLKIQRGSRAGKEIGVRHEKFLIGRSEPCQLRVNSDAISRRHCLITLEADGVFVQDLKSRNGTFVNGERVTQKRVLATGDQLRVGPLEFLVTFVKPAAAKEKPANPSDSSLGSEEEIADLLNDWFSESEPAGAPAAEIGGPGPEDPTREYRVDPAAPTATEPQVTPDEETASPETDETTRQAIVDETRRIPRPSGAKKQDAPKDTQEAAARMLRKFFNRN